MSDHVPLASFSVGGEPEQELFLPSKIVQERAHCSTWEKYIDLYEHSINDPEKFWSTIADKFWFKRKWSAGNFLQYNFDHRKGPVFVRWMADGVTNVCHNVLDRNIQLGLGDRVAYMWEGNEPGVNSRITYSELLNEVCKFANVLKRKGVRRGDRVTIYLPMIPELPVVMLACARIGAVHAVVFGGYSAEALSHRIMCTESKILITADGSYRATKAIRLKHITDKALMLCREQ
ncbi:AMP-binding domain containing protein [Trichuris trichiura]|uniref:acetate--CoA ligase n=1 Tax=Trichuris trichiura TaxID=36087 RepID=A0A077ZM59_TRITR|nr:AMP-binding domain containing protein [Trichuris trichiura]